MTSTSMVLRKPATLVALIQAQIQQLAVMPALVKTLAAASLPVLTVAKAMPIATQ